ncbi:Pao retrotransposon peptidase family protein [Dirofilaria immitis]|nr:Pao retrotransposon peptidase family protein [Dirofilaria immitis]
MRKLEKLLDEVRDIQPEQPDQQSSQEEICQQYVIKKRVIEERNSRLELYIETLESINKTWLEYIKSVSTPSRRKEEEEKFAQITDGDKGIFNLISGGKKAKIALSMYKNDIELALQRLSQSGELTCSTRTIQISFS